jgi:DNA-binding NtrC family response regulator
MAVIQEQRKFEKPTQALAQQSVSGGGNYLKRVSRAQPRKVASGRETFQKRVESLCRQAAALTDELENLKSFGFPVEPLSVEAGIDFYDEVRRFEIFMILRALKLSHGSQKRAAVLLRMNLTTLNTKIKTYKLR